MQVLPPVQLARSRVRGAAVGEGRACRDRPVPGAQWTRAALGRDKRDPPVRRIRRVTMWCRDRGRRPRRPVRPMAFPCTCRAVSAATSATLPCPARNGPAPPRSRQARPSRARHAMDPRRLGRDKRDPPVPGTQWTRAASVATSATLPCAVSAGLPCGAVVGADVLGGPRVRWRFRVRAAPPRSRQARPSRAPYPPGYHVVPW